MPKKRYYAVAVGRKEGIYSTWDQCKVQTDGFRGACFKGFAKESEAKDFLALHRKRPATAELNQPDPTTNNNLSGTKRPRKQLGGPCRHKISISIHFDGGSRGNPGVSGAGAQVVIQEGRVDTSRCSASGDHQGHKEDGSTNTETVTQTVVSETVSHLRHYVGKRATNNEAEYYGVIIGLEEANRQIQKFNTKHNGPTGCCASITVRGDSEMIIKQLKGEYNCNKANMRKLNDRVRVIVAGMDRFVMNVAIRFEHVYREDNTIADGLANEAMNARKSWTTSTHRAAKTLGASMLTNATDGMERSSHDRPSEPCHNYSRTTNSKSGKNTNNSNDENTDGCRPARPTLSLKDLRPRHGGRAGDGHPLDRELRDV